MSVSDEAVAAAALALYERDYGVTDWGIVNAQVKAAYMDEARTALGAAAPHMLAPLASDLEDQGDLEAILKQERWKYVAMTDEDGRPDGGYFEQSNDEVARAIIRAGFRRPTP